MIAKSRQMATHDFLLILSAAVVLTITAWPSPGERQNVGIRQPDGTMKSYSLAPEDPRLAKLRHELSEWNSPPHSSKLAVARWHAELAAMYVERTLPRPSTEDASMVMPVSFESDAVRQRQELAAAEARQRQNQYWRDYADKARTRIEAEEARQVRLQSLKASPPIVMGELSPAPHAPTTFLLAGLIGVATSIAFAFWNFAAPSIRLTQPLGAGTNTEAGEPNLKHSNSSSELQLSIPSRWVKVRQPWPVKLRQSAYALLILAAFVSILP